MFQYEFWSKEIYILWLIKYIATFCSMLLNVIFVKCFLQQIVYINWHCIIKKTKCEYLLWNSYGTNQLKSHKHPPTISTLLISSRNRSRSYLQTLHLRPNWPKTDQQKKYLCQTQTQFIQVYYYTTLYHPDSLQMETI